MKRRDPVLDPLPKWRQWLARGRHQWARSKDRRSNGYRNLKKAGRRGLTLAISMAGATLVSFGAYQIYAPAGYLTAGLLLWALQWNHGNEEGQG